MSLLEPTPRQVVAVLAAFLAAAAYPLRLIFRRRLDAQHSAILLLLGVLTLLFILSGTLRAAVMNLFGIGAPASALFFFAILIQGVAIVFFSSRLTQLGAQVRRLTQEVALLGAERDRRPAPAGEGGGEGPAPPAGDRGAGPSPGAP